jgi:hypothetical protein
MGNKLDSGSHHKTTQTLTILPDSSYLLQNQPTSQQPCTSPLPPQNTILKKCEIDDTVAQAVQAVKSLGGFVCPCAGLWKSRDDDEQADDA